jgi:hypothetical protein
MLGKRSAWSIVFLAVSFSITAEQTYAATTLFDSFGPGDGYNRWVAADVGGTPNNLTFAASFSLEGSESYSLDSIALAVTFFGLGTNQLDVSLTSDAGDMPGAILESFSFTDQVPVFDDILDPPTVGVSITHPILTPGTTYWLVASAPDDAKESWFYSPQTAWGLTASSYNGDPWSVTPNTLTAFRITGSPAPVPAPGVALLAALGTALTTALRRRRTL